VRLAEDPEVAEPAIAVIDEYQNRGLGRILLRLLMAAAQERGIRKFRATVLANNVPAQKLLAEADPTGELARQEDGVVAVTVPLPEEPVDLSDLTGTDRPLPLFRMLSLAARGALRLFTK
jgi:GNAT superfamily N-acetyltransferase